MDAFDTKHSSLYFNRELSLLKFQSRVLAQARDENTPLLERLRFLCISSTNLDEFFQIRVSGLKHRLALDSSSGAADGMVPEIALQAISQETHKLVEEQYRVWNDILIPELQKEDITFLKRSEWNEQQAEWVKEYFFDQLLPVLSPLGLDPAHPFPRVANQSLNFIISLEGKDAFGRESRIAIVQAPRILPRVIRLPNDISTGDSFVFLSSIIHTHIGDLFPGMNPTGCYQFRVTRDSDMFVEEEEVEDLMRAIKGELSSRRLTDAVRLEVADNCPDEMAQFLLRKFKLSQEDLYQVHGPVNLNRLLAVPDVVEKPELKFPPFTPGLPSRLRSNEDMFDLISQDDLTLYHPYESFAPVVDFLRQAAADPNVLAIKQTLYRAGNNSPLVDALESAAKAGKEVTVVVELRARFDEAANIELASRLQSAGAHVVYGVVGYKTHAKMLLVVRREGTTMKRYLHLGTGNYHVGTARIYVDYSFFTADEQICEDIHRVFQQLTGLGKATKLKKVIQSPFSLHKTMMKMIDAEAEHARNGKDARIIIKINSLVEPAIIQSLYHASQAGVKIDLIVRGICCLRPGVTGVSDNISVRSIIGRFLEHSRIFYFYNDGDEKIYCASADWMDRNFFRRVEVCFPIENASLKSKMIKFGLKAFLEDNSQAWELHEDGSYTHVQPGEDDINAAQTRLLEKYSAEITTQ